MEKPQQPKPSLGRRCRGRLPGEQRGANGARDKGRTRAGEGEDQPQVGQHPRSDAVRQQHGRGRGRGGAGGAGEREIDKAGHVVASEPRGLRVVGFWGEGWRRSGAGFGGSEGASAVHCTPFHPMLHPAHPQRRPGCQPYQLGPRVKGQRPVHGGQGVAEVAHEGEGGVVPLLEGFPKGPRAAAGRLGFRTQDWGQLAGDGLGSLPREWRAARRGRSD